MPGYRPYTLGSGDFGAQAVVTSPHYYKRKKWWIRAAIVLLCLGV